MCNIFFLLKKGYNVMPSFSKCKELLYVMQEYSGTESLGLFGSFMWDLVQSSSRYSTPVLTKLILFQFKLVAQL